jgi:hypothetical protein
VNPRAIVRPEGLDKLKHPVTSSGNEIRDFPACSILYQQNVLFSVKENKVSGVVLDVLASGNIKKIVM